MFIKAVESGTDYNTYIQTLVALNWILIVGAILASTLGLLVVAQIGDQSDLNLSNAVWTTLHGFLGQGGAPFQPYSASTKMVYLQAFVLGYLLLVNFSSALTSSLAMRQKTYPFSDLKSLYFNTDYKILTVDGTVYIDQFRYGDDLSQKFFKYRSVFSDSITSTIDKFENEDGLALFYGDYVATNFKSHHCNYDTVPQFKVELPLYFMAQKNSPYTKLINYE